MSARIYRDVPVGRIALASESMNPAIEKIAAFATATEMTDHRVRSVRSGTNVRRVKTTSPVADGPCATTAHGVRNVRCAMTARLCVATVRHCAMTARLCVVTVRHCAMTGPCVVTAGPCAMIARCATTTCRAMTCLRCATIGRHCVMTVQLVETVRAVTTGRRVMLSQRLIAPHEIAATTAAGVRAAVRGAEDAVVRDRHERRGQPSNSSIRRRTGRLNRRKTGRLAVAPRCVTSERAVVR
ncbi:MAG: hypothetical protein M3Z37_08490 [Candidatus Eremiobacteraeota bacterium]|nr:hypothetical protein [Candidatus Eremiobacteraeota bacterium]